MLSQHDLVERGLVVLEAVRCRNDHFVGDEGASALKEQLVLLLRLRNQELDLPGEMAMNGLGPAHDALVVLDGRRFSANEGCSLSKAVMSWVEELKAPLISQSKKSLHIVPKLVGFDKDRTKHDKRTVKMAFMAKRSKDSKNWFHFYEMKF